MKNFFANIFQFTRTDRLGIIALVVLLVLLIAANQYWYLIVPPKHYDYSQYEHLFPPKEPYQAKNMVKDSAQPEIKQPYKKDSIKAYFKPKPQQVVELNTADSITLVSLNGIGPSFASRIIKYRKLLGGFVKKEQLMEVYGFDKEKYDLVKPYVKVSGDVAKINLNTCTFKELMKHPYVKSYDITKAIFNLKKKLGKFQSVDEIKQIDLVNEEMYNKLAPYLTAP